MFFRTFHLFTLFGFRVRLDVSWLILALLVVTTTAQGFVKPPFELGTAAAVTLGLFLAFGLLMSIVLHELSHSLVGRRHGMQIRGITLFILGGVAEMEDEPHEPWGEFLMAIAGPLSSLAIGGACGLAAWGAGAASAPASVIAILEQLALWNVVLALFNLVPAFPLDGGRVLRSVLWGLKGDALWATRIASALGQAFGAFLVVGGIFVAVTRRDVTALLCVLIGWFLLRAAPMPYKLLKLRKRLDTHLIGPFVDVRPVVIPRYLPVADVLDRLQGRPDDDVLPVSDGTRITGFVALGDARRVPLRERAFTPVGEIATPLPIDAVVSSGMTAGEAVRRMQKLQLPTLLVVDAARLVGIVRWHDLRTFAEAG